jgi:hypothetical protein
LIGLCAKADQVYMHGAWEGCLEPLDEALAQVLVESYLSLLGASPSVGTCKAPLTRRRKRQARKNVVGMEAIPAQEW